MARNGKWFYLTIILVFAAGFLAGAASGVFYERKARPVADRGLPPPPGEQPGGPGMAPGGPGGPGGGEPDKDRESRHRDVFVGMLARELSLTPEQEKQVREILEKSEPEFLSLRKEMKSRFDAIRDRTEEDIRKILDEEQRAKMEKMENRPPVFRDRKPVGKRFEKMEKFRDSGDRKQGEWREKRDERRAWCEANPEECAKWRGRDPGEREWPGAR